MRRRSSHLTSGPKVGPNTGGDRITAKQHSKAQTNIKRTLVGHGE